MFNVEPAVLSSLREEFTKATRVRLLSMDDPHAPPVGSSGTVIGVNDIGSIMVDWDTGGRLNVLYGIDSVEKL